MAGEPAAKTQSNFASPCVDNYPKIHGNGKTNCKFKGSVPIQSTTVNPHTPQQPISCITSCELMQHKTWITSNEKQCKRHPRLKHIPTKTT